MTDSAPPPPPHDPYGQNPYGQSPYGQPQAAPGGRQPGSLLDRFVARLLDSILVGIVSAIIGGIIGAGTVMSGGSAGYGLQALSAVVGVVISLGYFTLMESTQGRTLGKMVMKLHTLSPTGGKPDFTQALKRNIFNGYGILGLIPFVGSFIGGILGLVAVILIAVQINGDPVKRQGWHDKFAGGTEVVKEG
ncbi:RDD family protein [Marmoricola endophyticus]|uniref:RDD family protein n=1 Tax=Marmoricola endophyticus TaxID=2040280 RepID=A0A917F2Q7_9ACTN|nr:RDD family protein [Marmoricola endophyticus]GGF47146.1 RDD family protein [Marmoricola endophyticus]